MYEPLVVFGLSIVFIAIRKILAKICDVNITNEDLLNSYNEIREDIIISVRSGS